MPLPTKPPVDNLKGLSLEDAYACVWFVWKRTFRKDEPFPAPFDLMQATIKSSFPPRPWGLPPAPDGPAQKFVIDIQRVILAHTHVKANVAFKQFVQVYDGGKTWADLAKLFHASGAKGDAAAHAAAMAVLPIEEGVEHAVTF